MLSPELIFGLATVALALGIAYGLMRYLTRDKSRDAETEAETRRQFDTPPRDETGPADGGG